MQTNDIKNNQIGGKGARQEGHSNLTSVQLTKQSRWKKWLHGVLITFLSFSIDSSISEALSYIESVKKFCKQILHSRSLLSSEDFILKL